ncbi:hypothetical protein AB1N83_013403, partial [Pleurotus pulmonarius]
KPRCASTCQKA